MPLFMRRGNRDRDTGRTAREAKAPDTDTDPDQGQGPGRHGLRGGQGQKRRRDGFPGALSQGILVMVSQATASTAR